MSRHLSAGILLGAFLLCLPAADTFGAPPWASLIPFRKVEADPLDWYELTEDQGPWMVLAATFRGPQSQRLAHELVLELRKKFRLPAYLHARQFDFTRRERGIGLNPDGTPRTMRHQNAEKVLEVAVLVGDFHSVDDPRAQRALETIKRANPVCLDPKVQRLASDSLVQLRAMQRSIHRKISNGDKKKMGPMRAAFVTANPMLPPEFFAPQGLDPLVVEMNRDVMHSLLDCKGTFSVKVATFRGLSTMNLREIEALKSGVKSNTTLAEAARNAHLLTTALREEGVEAYEFHDRHESVVCVGAFNSVGTPRRDGKIEINPAIHRIMQDFGPQKQPLRGAAQAQVLPRVVKLQGPDGEPRNIQFDVQPVPIKVPRRSLSADYARRDFLR